MDLTQSFSDQQWEDVLVTNVSYEIEEIGHHIDTPIFHIRGRNADGTLIKTEVEGFRPYFGIKASDFRDQAMEICNDRRVIGIGTDCSPDLWQDAIGFDDDQDPDEWDVEAFLSNRMGADVYHTTNPYTSIYDEELVKIYTRVPGDVSGLSGDLDCETFEADIPFVRRFLISTEIYQAFSVDTNKDRVRYENWPGESDGMIVQEIEPCEPPAIKPRMIVYDIEVATEGKGFPQPERALQPITAISAYDNYDDSYRLWGLVSEEWEQSPDDIVDDVLDDVADRDGFPNKGPDGDDLQGFELFENETELVESFHSWVLERDPDIFTGYNADGFDTPYLIQRSYNIQALSIKEYGKTGTPGVWVEEYNGNRQVNFSLPDRVTLDILDAYKKTQFRALDSYRLDAVAEAELGYGKTGLAGDELDDAWHYTPIEFFAYSIRDAQATAEVEAQSGLLNLFENLRQVTGAPYETAVSNGPMLDTLFLRRAHEKGYILPTNTKPDENIYHGAKVFDPVPGVHKNCVYPDLKSMYPNLFAMLNLGSETIVGSKSDLEKSEYSEDDCYRFPVDEREFAVVKKGEPIGHIDREEYKGVKTPQGGVREMFDPVIDWFYVVKPEIQESFVRDTVDELIELKYKYSGQLYSAVKRVTNSVYGIAGDSASGGKGFRLYDRRVAEGITLAGRLTITHTAEEFTNYLNDNYDQDSILVGGDTDSSVTSMPNAPNMETAWDWAQEAVDYVDQSYDQFVVDTFGFDPEDEHRLAVELESLASGLFYMEGDTEENYRTADDGFLVKDDTAHGVRKRYAQHLVWDDDDGWLDTEDPDEGYEEALEDPEDRSQLKKEETVDYEIYESGALQGMDPHDNVSITGFEYVRSDSAQITRDAQMQILCDILLTSEPESRIKPYLQQLVDDIESGDVPLEDLARPKGISQQLDEYGWKDIDELDDDQITDDVEAQGGLYRQTPGPTYRGAKYVDDWFSWEDLGEGSKPLKIPIEKVRGDEYPQVYEYHKYPKDDARPDSPEVGREVDAISVENTDRIPEQFIIDRETIIEKELEDKLKGILNTMDMDWDDLLSKGSQSGLDQFL